MAPSHEDGPVETKLRALGFDPGIVVHQIDNCDVTVADIQAALFEHRWDKPHLLVIGEVGDPHYFPIVVDTVTAAWERRVSLDEEEARLGVSRTPSYYVAGKPLRTWFDATDPIEVRAFFWGSTEIGHLSSVYVQVITVRDKASLDADAPFEIDSP